jgi:DNA mismatch repair protein MutL
MISRVAGNDVGTRIRLRDGEVAEEGSSAASPGTAFVVRRLFSSQPARLKFIRSPGSESTQLTSVVSHYAMAYPEVRFELTVDGRVALQTPGNGSLTDAVAAVYGADVASAAIEIDAPPEHEGAPGVRGVVVEPRLHRASRNYIGLYVNRRWVKNRALTFAVEEAYQGMMPVARHPIAVLDLRIPPDEVDVNVHPTKAEVRLRNERAVFAVLQRAVRRALSDSATVPPASPSLWTGGPAPAERPPLFLTQTPVQTRLASLDSKGQTASSNAPAVTDSRQQITDLEDGAGAATMIERLPLLRAVGQVGNTYVIAEGPDGMYLVDQHAAHERVLYEHALAAVRAGTPDVQGLLEPLTIELSAPHRALVAEHAAAFERLGFDIEHFGDAAFVVRMVPSPLAGEDVARHIVELLDRIARDSDAQGEAAHEPSHRVAASLACHAAVRAGMVMSPVEQRELLRQLEASESPRTCPHGRPTMIHLTADAIAREFRRK